MDHLPLYHHKHGAVVTWEQFLSNAEQDAFGNAVTVFDIYTRVCADTETCTDEQLAQCLKHIIEGGKAYRKWTKRNATNVLAKVQIMSGVKLPVKFSSFLEHMLIFIVCQ